MRTERDLEEAIVHGAVKRVRPKMMTVMAPSWASSDHVVDGTGADVMKRIAAPMVGGLATSFLLELLVYPVIYAIWKWNVEMKKGRVVPHAVAKGAAIHAA
jgi:Cu(I)/Ag(I) efflux system membrane protein CusA/SilA